MKTDGNIYRQDLTIRENTIFQGLVMGSITVAPNVILEMRGSAAMDVIRVLTVTLEWDEETALDVILDPILSR